MHQEYFACLVILFSVALAINGLHVTLYELAKNFSLADNVRKRVYLFAAWMLACLALSAVSFLPFWAAFSFIVHPQHSAALPAAGLSLGSLTLVVLTSNRIHEFTRPIRSLRSIQKGQVGDDHESLFLAAIDGVFTPSGYLWSIVATWAQVAVFATSIARPEISRFAIPAHTPQVSHSVAAFSCYVAAIWGLLYTHQYLFNPGRKIAESYLYHFKEADRSVNLWNVAVSRWRTVDHRRGFRIADALIRSLSGLKKRVADEDYERMDDTYRRVANGIRRRSIRTNIGELDKEYIDLCAAALSLAVYVSPIEACKKAEPVVAETPPEAPRSSHFGRYLSFLDTFIDRYAKSLMVLMGAALAAYLIISGKIETLIQLLMQIIASK